MLETFPEIQRGGSLILAWQIKNKNVLVVGGGEVSHRPSNTSCMGIDDSLARSQQAASSDCSMLMQR
jgi:siroheme synthase (precorrin-2 oxidase/ferrochelatase)